MVKLGRKIPTVCLWSGKEGVRIPRLCRPAGFTRPLDLVSFEPVLEGCERCCYIVISILTCRGTTNIGERTNFL